MAISGTAAGANVINGLIYRSISQQTADVVYMSFLYSFDTPAASANEAFLQFGLGSASNAEPNASVGVSGNGPSGTGAEQFFARIGAGTTNTTNVSGSASISKNTTYLLVARISKGTPGASNPYNSVSLFVNPNNLDESSPTLQISGSNSTTNQFNWFDLRVARLDIGDTYFFDNLTIGTTFADVVPVPEAASLGLLGIGAMALGMRKRKK